MVTDTMGTNKPLVILDPRTLKYRSSDDVKL